MIPTLANDAAIGFFRSNNNTSYKNLHSKPYAVDFFTRKWNLEHTGARPLVYSLHNDELYPNSYFTILFSMGNPIKNK